MSDRISRTARRTETKTAWHLLQGTAQLRPELWTGHVLATLGEMRTSKNPSPRDEGVASRMRQQKTSHTSPEVLLADALRRRHFKVEMHSLDLPGKPDIVLPVRGVAVFVHGCFWHGCRWHYQEPRHNSTWWREKIQRNKARDRKKAAALRRLGWHVVTVWEHTDPDTAAERIRQRSA